MLSEQYRRHALGVRSVSVDTVAEELLYLTRLFDHFGPPGTPAELFAALDPDAASRFLVRYAEEHTPGSRRWVQGALRSCLRFAYQCGDLERDLSGIVPAVRTRRLGHVPRGLPAECIAALNTRLEPAPTGWVRGSRVQGPQARPDFCRCDRESGDPGQYFPRPTHQLGPSHLSVGFPPQQA
jgi:hypothetical protein